MNPNFKPKQLNKIMRELIISGIAYVLSILLTSLPTFLQFFTASGMFNNEASFNIFPVLFILGSILKPIAIIVFIKFLYDALYNLLIAIDIYINKNI